ncbi:MAG: glycosyltransferase family 4 protein [Planctomycetes bacterium]|nr:glycosyltransferase family 4 protein [Planctomycetota bacterium]
MRVAIDCSPACGSWTGVGRYVHDLVTGLQSVGSPAAGVFQGHRGPLDPRVRSACSIASRYDFVGGRIGAFLRLPRVLGSLRAELYHSTSTIAVPGPGWNGRVVGTVQDCYPLSIGSDVSRRSRRLFATLLRNLLQRAAIIICPTTFSADEVRSAGYAGPLEVVPYAVRNAVAQLRPAAAPVGPYVLSIGAIEPRKRLDLLCAAYATAGRDRLPPWYHIGPTRHDPDGRIRAGMVAAGCEILGYVEDADRLAWLAHARVLAQPSSYEGFGYPPLEAMSFGIPVLAFPSPAMREVLADAALWVEDAQPEAWARAIAAVAMDANEHRRWSQRGLERAAGFTLERMIADHRRIYDAACA